MNWPLITAWFLYLSAIAGMASAFLFESRFIEWVFVCIVGLILVRQEALIKKLDKFQVVDEDDD